MRKYIAAFVRVFVLAAFLIAAVQSSADAAWKSVQVMNHTGYTITGLYISSDDNDWGGNLISGSLQNGYYVDVSYRDDLNTNFALRIIFADGSDYYWRGSKRQNLNGVGRITFYRDGNGFRVQKS